jgi:anti-anti-sigma factor
MSGPRGKVHLRMDALPPTVPPVGTDAAGRRLVRPAGEVDVVAARQLAAALRALVGAPGADVVVDLTDVTFIDSTGLGAIVATRRRLTRQGIALHVIAPAGSPARRTIDLAGLAGVLERPG